MYSIIQYYLSFSSSLNNRLQQVALDRIEQANLAKKIAKEEKIQEEQSIREKLVFFFF